MVHRWTTRTRSAALLTAVTLAATTLAAGALAAPSSAGPTSTTPPAVVSPPITQEQQEHGWFDETTLWDSQDDTHENYHVHGLAVTPNDTILAFTEGRHDVCDAGPRDIVLRRSTDAGQTWSPNEVVVASADGESWGNPSAVVDEHTGDVFLFFGLSLQDEGNTTCSGDRQEVYVVSSSDDGQTWTEPVELDHLFDGNEYGWTLHGPGPGHGIQLDSGRLLLQVLHRREVVGHSVPERLYGVSMIYSDDGGATWKAGEPVPVDVNYPINESRIWQREDGAVVVNGRSAAGGHRLRITSVSTDDGMTWSDPVLEPATDRYTAVDAGFVRMTGADGVARVLHSRPDSARRENLTVSVSYDDGYTYRYDKVVNPGPSYYSEMATLSDGTIVLIYGRDGEILAFPERIVVARFDLAWLSDGRDDGTDGAGITEHEFELGITEGVRTGTRAAVPELQTITPDTSGNKSHARVFGAPKIVAGADGSALRLGPGDHLEVPRSASVVAAGGTFTAAAWVRTEATSSQAVMWAYRMGSGLPQWWLRVEPGDNRLRAFIDTGSGTRSLVAQGDFADGEWHHVALTRDGQNAMLYVDGEPVAEGKDPAGSTSSGARTGIHIGQRPDGANPFDGVVDEMYLYDRALTPAEVGVLAGDHGDADGGPEAPAGAVVHLPLQQTRRHPVRPGRPEIVTDDAARGGRYLRYEATEAGDFVEIPFELDEPGSYDVAVRHHRLWDRGKVQVSIDGEDLPDGLVDLTLPSNEAYDTFQHGTIELDAGRHRVRFTLVEEGHLGGATIAPDHLTLISAAGTDDLVRDVTVDDESVGAFEMVSGTWSRATGQDGHPYFGVSYRSAPGGADGRLARWRPDIPVTDTYQVLVWYVSHPNRASNAPYTIHHAEGSTTVEVDQRGQARSLADGDRPGVWVNLGSFPFEAGSAATIELSNDADGFVIADGVVLTRDPVPETPAGLEASGASSSSIEVSWSAADGADGYHVERRNAGDGAWEFAGTVPADETTFTSTGLSPDTVYEHRVYAVAQPHPGRPARGSMASDPVAATTEPADAGGGSIELTTPGHEQRGLTGAWLGR